MWYLPAWGKFPTVNIAQNVLELAQRGDVRARRLLQQTRELAEAVCTTLGDRRFVQPLVEASFNNRLDLAVLKSQADQRYLSRERLAELLESYR